LFRTGFVLLYPLFPTSLLTPTTCAFSHCPPELKSYLRIILHALDPLYDTCSDSFFSSPLSPSSPNVPLQHRFGFCFLSVLPPHPGSRWDRRGLRVTRRVVIACVPLVCKVFGLLGGGGTSRIDVVRTRGVA
jgi:hypothetical protein